MTTRRLLPFVAALAVVPGLAACGDESDDSGTKADQPIVKADRTEAVTPAALAAAASRTTAKGGVRMSLTQSMQIGGQDLPTTAEGVFDSKARQGEMTMHMDLSGLPGGSALGKVDQKMIMDGFTFYMSSPLMSRALPGGKKWMKIDIAASSKKLGIDLSSLTGGQSQDPTQALQYLKAASGNVQKLGTETVRGEPTTHYKGTIDFRKVADTVPAAQRAATRRSIEQVIKLSGSSTSPMEVWVGDDGLVRRLEQTIGSKLGGQSAQVKQRVEMYDFGTKVKIRIPPDSEVTDVSKLGESLRGGLRPG